MEISFFELLLIALIGFLVLGPEELLRRAHQLGRFVRKMRTEMNNFRILAEEELIKKTELDKMKEHAQKVVIDFQEAQNQVTQALKKSAQTDIHDEPQP
jgi:Tat protein translocase TatB subunit